MINIRVMSISARNGGEETEISFVVSDPDEGHSSKESFIIQTERYLMLGVCVGESDCETYDAVQRFARVWDAVKRGIRILGYGAYSERSLRMKLISKGYERDIVEEAISYILSKGLIRENDDAVRAAEKMAAKLWGKKRIASGLYEKGYSSQAVEFALCSLEDGGVDYAENCRRLVSARYANSLGDRAATQKTFAALMRYGYTASEIKQAISCIDE